MQISSCTYVVSRRSIFFDVADVASDLCPLGASISWDMTGVSWNVILLTVISLSNSLSTNFSYSFMASLAYNSNDQNRYSYEGCPNNN